MGQNFDNFKLKPVKTCSHGHHDHGHHHFKQISTNSSNNITIALFLNLSFAFIELFGGFWTNSTAIQADAFHDFGDSMALGLALLLQIFSKTKPTNNFTYGFKRLSLVSAFSTSLLLFAGSSIIAYQASLRFNSPLTPHLKGMFWLAILGILVNGYAAFKMSSGSTQNEKAISWHMIEDLLGWIAILISSIVMNYIDIPWLDPTLAIVIAFIVLVGAAKNLWASFRLFLQSAPQHLEEDKIKVTIQKVSGVQEVHSIQIWSLDGNHHVCSAKVKISDNSTFEEWKEIRKQVQKSLTHLEQGEIELTLEPI